MLRTLGVQTGIAVSNRYPVIDSGNDGVVEDQVHQFQYSLRADRITGCLDVRPTPAFKFSASNRQDFHYMQPDPLANDNLLVVPPQHHIVNK